MWRPPERIKWQTSPGSWPSGDEALRARLFSPVQVGSVRLAQRTWVPAMVPWRATEDGFVTDDNVAWYRRFAEGRPGAIVVEATGIRDIPSGPLLRTGDDRFIPGLRRIVDAVREASGGETRLFIQIIDFLNIRRRPAPEKFLGQHLRITDDHRAKLGQLGLGQPALSDDDVRARLLGMDDEKLAQVLAPSELDMMQNGLREKVTDMHLPHVRELPQVLPDLFAAAAKRAMAAGFDGVELHYAHAYTMASFLSALNTRNDGYGGSREHRVRLPLEVFKAVRSEVGRDYPVGCRFLADEIIAGGSGLDDAIWFGRQFAAAGMDFLSLSRGGKFEDSKQPAVGAAAYPYTGRSGYECMPQYVSDQQGPFGRNIAPSAAIRAAIRADGLDTPVVTTGGIYDFAQAEGLLQSDRADIVGFARQALADPDWFAKVSSGHGAAVRLCRFTNYCEALDQKHRQVTCELWDREGLDQTNVSLAKDGKRRLLPPAWAR